MSTDAFDAMQRIGDARLEIAKARRQFQQALDAFHRSIQAGQRAGLSYRELGEAAGISKMQAWRICDDAPTEGGKP